MANWTVIEILRILCGLWFLPHLYGKSMNFSKATGTFEQAGFRPAKVFLSLTICIEALACVGLVFGIYPRLAAWLGVFVLVGASYAIVKINGFNWRWQKMGPEFPIFWALVCALTTLA